MTWETEQNLLFGVVAVQLKRIDQQQLSQALAEWMAHKAQPFANVLIERGWIGEQDQIEIEEEMRQQIHTHQGNLQQTLSVSLSTGLLASLQEQLSAEDTQVLTEFLSVNTPPGGLNETVELSNVLQPLETRQRYHLIRIQGEGGLGRVWVAKDQSLGREVALKEIRNADEASREAIARFQREARITSRLEHPNIMPIYDLVEDEADASLYYTMRLVHGQTLDDAIKNYHARNKQQTGSELPLRELLSAFIGVCQAVGYAHSRGVIHRDIKPANVLIGEFGEVILLDWGLAGFRDESNETNTTVSAIPEDMAETQEGAILGTPAFMAPEQARGQTTEIDHLADIYGLGAMLFVICTGKSPHRGKTSREVLQNILTQDQLTPRDLDSRIPRPLDAICQKALAKRKEDRYSSALQLRDDIQRWLADEPVSVYQERRLERAGRWFRRHRNLAIGTMAVLAAMVVISLIAALFINQARLREAEALASEQDARKNEREAQTLADQRRQQALEAIGKWQVDLSDVMRYHPRVQAVREKLLVQAAEEYHKLATDLQNQPLALAEYARIYLRLGDVRRRLGKPKDALAAYDIAERSLKKLTNLAEDQERAWMELAKCQGAKAAAMVLANQFEKADAEFRQAMETLSHRPPPSPSAFDSVETVTELRLHWGELLIARNQLEDAKRLLHKARTFAELDPQARWHPPIVRLRASALHASAQVLSIQTEYQQALELVQEAMPLWDFLLDRNADDAQALEGRANALVISANAYSQLGDNLQGLACHEAARRDYEALFVAFPDVPHYRQQRVVGLINLAQALHRLARNQEARPPTEEALSSAKQLTAAFSNHAPYMAVEASARSAFGHVLREQNQWNDAKLAFSSAGGIREKLVKAYPQTLGYSFDLAITQANLGFVHGLLKELPDSETQFQLAFDRLSSVMQDPNFREEAKLVLAIAKTRWGDVCWLNDQKPRASKIYEEAAKLLESQNKTPQQRFELAWFRLFCFDPKLRNAKQAHELAIKLTNEHPRNGQFQMLLGISLIQQKQTEQAISVLQSASKLPDADTAMAWLHLAEAHHMMKDHQSAQSAYQTGLDRLNANQPGNSLLHVVNNKVIAMLNSVDSL